MQQPTTSFLDWTRKFAIEEACLDELARRKPSPLGRWPRAARQPAPRAAIRPRRRSAASEAQRRNRSAATIASVG